MNGSDGYWPESVDDLLECLRAEWANHRGDARLRLVLVGFRLTQFAMGNRDRPRIGAYPLIAAYRILTEWLLGIEIRPKTRIGPGLTVFHGYGIVINNEAVLGRSVTLRHGVTIGHARAGGGSPVIGDRVTFGANSMAIGSIMVGSDSRVGPGVVLRTDTPQKATVVAMNPITT